MRRTLIWRNWAMRSFHPMSLAAMLAARALGAGMSGGRWRRLVHELLAPYRPELHYMRGPGPKWREKHGGLSER